MEFTQWLLRRQGLDVSTRGWFVYCNARRDLAAFDAQLEFRIKLIPYDGEDRGQRADSQRIVERDGDVVL